MNKNYILTLSTTENEPINKYYHLVTKHTEDKLSTMYFIDFDYPTLKISDTQENVKWFIELLETNGFEVSVKFEMDYTKTSVMSLEEYDRFLNEISNGKVGIQHESGGWFYTMTEDVSDEDISKMLESALGMQVTNVIVDTANNKVAITY